MKSSFYIFIIFCGISFSNAQVEKEWIQNLLEDYLNQNPDHNFDLMELENDLYELINFPVTINSKKLDEIDRLFFLNPILKQSLKNYLIEFGDLISLFELQSIPGFSTELARNLSKIVRLKNTEFLLDRKKVGVLLNSGINQSFFRSKAFFTGKYLGSAHRFFFRSKIDFGKRIQVGLSFDKDPGENYWNKRYPMGFAHLSAYVQLIGKKFVKRLIIGDYKVFLGQGLLIYQGYGFGKTIDLIGNVRSRSGININTSLSENYFLRGLAAELQVGAFRFIPFVSYKRLGATVYNDGTNYFKSIDFSGFLKTESDIIRHQKLNEVITGFNTQYRNHIVEFNFNYMFTGFNYEFKNNTSPYQIKLPQGKQFHLISLDHKIHLKNGFLFGEIAWQPVSGGIATIQGILFSLGSKLSLLTSARYYAPRFLSFYGSALSENSSNRNEIGLMVQVDYNLTTKLKWSFYVDLFHFPWMKFNVDQPSNGFELNSRLHYKWNRKMNIYFNFRLRSKEENRLNSNTSANVLSRWYKLQFRLHFNKQIGHKFTFSSRVEANLIQTQKMTTGFFSYFDLKFSPVLKLDLMYRVGLFSTDDFDNAVYTLERGIATVNSYAVYSGEGLTNYFYIKLKLVRSLAFNFKVYFTHFFNQLKIGSGNEEITGNIKGGFGIGIKYLLH